MTYMLEGIDVSDVQGFINWKKVKDSGIAYAFCKATDGETYMQKRFKLNWDGIKSVGLIRGAYHFAHTKNDPIKEATHFVATVGKLDPADMLALDIEDNKNTLSKEDFINWNISFLETVEKLSNVTPIVYTGGPYFDEHGGRENDKGEWYPNEEIVNKLSRYPLWLAAYTKNPDKYVPYVWKKVGWTIWQRSGDQCAVGDTVLHVPGINVVVDRNQYRGTAAELEAFAKGLHHEPKQRIPQVPLIPIELDLHSEPAVIDKSADEPLRAHESTFLGFFQKIFGIK